MGNPNVMLNFIYYSVSEKVIFYRNVNDKVFGNVLNPTPDLTEVENNWGQSKLKSTEIIINLP